MIKDRLLRDETTEHLSIKTLNIQSQGPGFQDGNVDFGREVTSPSLDRPAHQPKPPPDRLLGG